MDTEPAALGFGPFRLIRDTGELLRDGTPVPIQCQPARLLALLVTRAGEVVTREEIREHLWVDTAVVYDQSINYCIRQIRIALGVHASTMVETLPRRGYRFTIPVERVETSWWPLTMIRSIRPVAIPLTAGVVLGLAIGTTMRRPTTIMAPGTELTATISNLIARVDEGWQHVRAHMAGEITCPYLQLLIPNSRGTHRSS